MTTLRTEATAKDKVLLVLHFVKLLTAVFLRAIQYPLNALTGAAKANCARKDIVFALLRAHLSGLNVPQEILTRPPPTEKAYLDMARRQGFEPDTTVLNSGLKLHWLGNKSANKVLLVFHGGGFAIPAAESLLRWYFDLTKELSKKSVMSVVVVSYTLTPQGQYPVQLRQAAEALDWLLHTQGKKPGDVFISGDSAGGNMALSLMSHLLHPHPEAINIDLKEPLAGVVLICPWISFETNSDSFTRNRCSDMIVPGAVHRWASMFLGSNPSDNYTEAIRADPSWWSGLEKIVCGMLIWGGTTEVLYDSIREFAQKLKSVYPQTDVVFQPGAGHTDFIFDYILGSKEKAAGTQVIESWIAQRL